ncbi:MAG: hypothetical protein ABSH14_08905 [Verrucomicrobiia bacterium]
MKRRYAIWTALGLFGVASTGLCASNAEVQTSIPAGTNSGAAFQFAAEPDFPSSTLAGLGLRAIKTEAVFVVHTQAKAALAAQVAPVLEAMNRFSREMVGPALRLHGLVLIGNASDLPVALRHSTWVNIDGVTCLVQQTGESSLPMRNDFSNYMIFPLLAHENVDDGIKAECLGGPLTERSASSRWFVEGIADYCAYQASRKYQGDAAVRLLKKHYLEGLGRLSQHTRDIESGESWWPKNSSGNPDDVQYSYAAAHFAVRTLSEKKGTAWIRQTLERIKGEKTGLATTSADFARIASPLTGQDVSALIRHIKVEDVRNFAGSL